MPRRRPRVSRHELLDRTATINAVKPRVRLFVEEPRSPYPEFATDEWLDLEGQLDEPLKDQRAIVISLYPEDNPKIGTSRPASIGAIIQVKPEIVVVVRVPQRAFDRLWVFAMSGRLTHAYMSCVPPRYGRALVPTLSFSTEREE